MKHVFHDSALSEAISDTEELAKRLPDNRLDGCLQEADDARRLHHEIGVLGRLHQQPGFNRNQTMQRVAAGIPGPVLAWLTQVDPDFMTNKEKFYRWLAQHPEWDARLTPKL